MACGNAEKLGRLIMAPRAEVDSGEWLRQPRNVGDRVVGPLKDPGLVSFAGGRPPAASVAKFANESSILKKCLVSLLHVLNSSRSLLFGRSDQLVRYTKDGRERTMISNQGRLACCDRSCESAVPVDSETLEAILRAECENAQAETNFLRMSPTGVAKSTDDTGDSSVQGPREGYGDVAVRAAWPANADEHLCLESSIERLVHGAADLQLYNEITQIGAFGCASLTARNDEIEHHFHASPFLVSHGAMARNRACINLVELAGRQCSTM